MYAIRSYYAANRDVAAMLADCLEFAPRYAVMADETAACQLRDALAAQQSLTEVLSGAEALCEVARLAEVELVMAAIVGAAGLLPALAAVKAGKTVLLANKEALVMSGAFRITSYNVCYTKLLRKPLNPWDLD